jgi:hypothetical protein
MTGEPWRVRPCERPLPLGRTPGVAAVLHLVSSRHADVMTWVWYQIAKASSSNATASRKVTGASTAVRSVPGGCSAQGRAGDHDLALWSCWSARIGRSRVLRRPGSASTRLLAYCSVQCQAAGSSSPSTAGYAAAWSVTTSTGMIAVCRWPARRSDGRPWRRDARTRTRR